MPVQALREFLDKNRIKYTLITHSPAYTAQEIAAMAHIKGRELAKTVIVKVDGTLAMAVLPASFQVDLDLLRMAAGASAVSLATEAEFRNRFPGCETGAMPPFGNLFNMPVYVAEQLTRDDEIAFNAGTHSELVRLAFDDYARLVKPVVCALIAQRMSAAS
jgi:Ala-tRNA(Pro) deacylase